MKFDHHKTLPSFNSLSSFSQLVTVFFLAFTLGASAQAQQPVFDSSLFLNFTDRSFGGYFMDIDRTMQSLNISRLQAHELQARLRTELEIRSGSLQRDEQTPFLEAAFAEAIDWVLVRGESFGGFSFPTGPLEEDDFYLVLDLDETLLSQWFDPTSLSAAEAQDVLITDEPDWVMDWKDRLDLEETSSSSNTLLYSPKEVHIRPYARDFIDRISKVNGFKGVILFTAKSHGAAMSLYEQWRQKDPELFEHIVGTFTRNHLRLDSELPKPSKDLRMIDPMLRNVFLVDDNESRVMQRELGFALPKYNASAYLNDLTRGGYSEVQLLNIGILPYIARTFESCQNRAGSTIRCLQQVLGERDAGETAIASFLHDLKLNGYLSVPPVSTVVQSHVFEPEFFIQSYGPVENARPLVRSLGPLCQRLFN